MSKNAKFGCCLCDVMVEAEVSGLHAETGPAWRGIFAPEPQNYRRKNMPNIRRYERAKLQTQVTGAGSNKETSQWPYCGIGTSRSGIL